MSSPETNNIKEDLNIEGQNNYIIESEDYISYLGVFLPKVKTNNNQIIQDTEANKNPITNDKPVSKNPLSHIFKSRLESKPIIPLENKLKENQFVPKREQYKDFINDPEIALPLQRDIAIAFLSGEPLLIDGGTSLGKTTTVKKMAAELGWEVHYANLNGATDVQDLMGRYIPNPNKNKPEDPEYIFADGKVTSGLRQEEGKIKVIILDEFNSGAPNILIRLHEVLDSLERNGNVVLAEDASEAIPVSRETTKIVALMNPPGRGYIGREPLDPALLRRWIYKKMPSELPEGTFSYATSTLFGREPKSQKISSDLILRANKNILNIEQLNDIPGIEEILEKYKEFHKGAKDLLKERQIAQDQPQTFTFDDRMEPHRVRDFIQRFYTGDINETFQQALKYYYSNKLENDLDRKKLDELIRLVEYNPKDIISKRKGLEKEQELAKSFEEKCLDYLEKLLEEDNISKNWIAEGLVGLDSKRAWGIREKLIKDETAGKNWIVKGLVNLDSEEAWKMRSNLLAHGVDYNHIIISLAGVDSEKAWEWRELYLNSSNILRQSFIKSLNGLDSKKAWEWREKYLEDEQYSNCVATSLTGLDSKRAWEIREKYIKIKGLEIGVILSLCNLDSKRAWEIREQFILKHSDDVARSLAGLDSKRAWEMRNKLLSENHINFIALGLAGLDSEQSWKFRDQIKNTINLDPDYLAQSVAGDELTFVWQIKNQKEIENTKNFEKAGLNFIQGLLSENIDKRNITVALIGLDSDEAWEIREETFDYSMDIEAWLGSVTGLDSEKAWQIRGEYFEENISAGILSLANVDSERAWETREEYFENEYCSNYVATSLAGLESERAWQMRKIFLGDNITDIENIIDSLAGLDSEEAWGMRDHILNNTGAIKDNLLKSLVGLDSEKAWEMRNDDKTDGPVAYDELAKSLAGLNSKKSWKLRKEILKNDESCLDLIIKSLVGINSEMVQTLKNTYLDKRKNDLHSREIVASSYFGDQETFIGRLKAKNNTTTIEDEKEIESEILEIIKEIKKDEDKLIDRDNSIPLSSEYIDISLPFDID